MFYKTVFNICLAVMLFPFITKAQNNEVVRCHTMEADAALRAQHPELGTLEEFDEWFNPLVRAYKQNHQNQEFAEVLNIPVVFHLIHDNEAVGSGGNLDPIYVNAQLEQLNNDFRKITGTSGDNADPVGADSEVQFCMAAVDPDGNVMAEPGMNRINAIDKGWNSGQYCVGAGPTLNTNYIENTVKPESQWNPDNYLNIWVLEMSCGLLGYAQFPSNSGLGGLNANGGDADTDGVVVLNTSVGSTDTPHPQGGSYDSGRTLTHEIGHWIGLRHIWGDSNCGNDFCDDTPTQQGSSSGNCPSSTTCDGNADMTKNYMDYSNDICMNIFSEDQKTRMRTVMDQATNCPRRWILNNSTVCDLTTKVSFVSGTSMITEETTSCNSAGSRVVNIPMSINIAPASVVTVNLSYSGSATLNKDFSAPTSITFPSGQTDNQNIAITIFEDGATEADETITITFSVSGAEMGSIINHTGTIVNDDVAPSSSSTPIAFLSEDFNSGAAGWTIGDGSNDNNTWEYKTHQSGSSLNGSAMALADSDEAGGAMNEVLTSPVINPGNATNLTLTFDQYFRQYSQFFDFNETATVEVYNGTSWVQIYQLVEADGDVGAWNAPDQQSIDITTHANPNMQVRFTYEADNDYHWAIDNVEISGLGAVSVQTAMNTTDGFAEHNFGPMETVHYYDQTTGNIMLTLQNNSNYDYGCTTVQIDRAGATAEPAWQSGKHTTGKAFLVTPTNNSPSASDDYTITLYYTATEINNWVSQSGAAQADLNMAKTAGSIASGSNANSEVGDATEGSFGTDYTYSATFNTGFSGFAMGNVQNAALPIELIDFAAKANRQSIDLNWQTAQEINNKGFDLQRSEDGGKTFTTIGWIDGQGDSETVVRYAFEDMAVATGMIYYYRLRQVDFDETVSFSKIVQAALSANGTTFTMAPNPVDNQLTLKFDAAISDNTIVEIIDIQGRVIQQQMVTASTLELSVADLTTGVYFVKVQNGQTTQVERLLKK